ncbi:MAG: arginase family protein [Longimicrobiales bacterium]
MRDARGITIIGAPSSIGIKPYEDGTARALDRAPAVLREAGLVARLDAADGGDVTPPPYRDFVRAPDRTRNEDGVASYSRALAERIGAVLGDGRFALVLGGDCSIVLGSLLGARRADGSDVALVYVDGHADFATPAESRTGSAASMCLGLAVGRGETLLARLAGESPLVRPEDVALVGRRDEAEPWYGHDALHASPVLDVPGALLRQAGYAETADVVLDRVARPDRSGFWIHLDADVLDPSVMPAVDSPEPGGPGLEELARLLTPLARHPKALGLELTIYDPALDPEHDCARRLVDLLATVLADG